MQIEYSKFKGNFKMIVENIKSLEKYQPNFRLNTFTLKKARSSGLYKDTVLNELRNLVVTTLDRNFNAAFDVSFSKFAGINKND